MPGGAGGNDQNSEVRGATTRRNSTECPASCSVVEKRVTNDASKDPTAKEKSDGTRVDEGPQGSKSKSFAPPCQAPHCVSVLCYLCFV